MTRTNRSYIRLAAYLADLPDDHDRLVLERREIEDVLGERLPPHSRFPFWWRNDESKTHSRAWLASGWEVVAFDTHRQSVTFGRTSRRTN